MSQTTHNVNLAELFAYCSGLDRKSKTQLTSSLAGQLGAILMYPKKIHELGNEAPSTQVKSNEHKTKGQNAKAEKPKVTQPRAHPDVRAATKAVETAKKALIAKKKELGIKEPNSLDPRLDSEVADLKAKLANLKELKVQHPTEGVVKQKPKETDVLGAGASTPSEARNVMDKFRNDVNQLKAGIDTMSKYQKR